MVCALLFLRSIKLQEIKQTREVPSLFPVSILCGCFSPVSSYLLTLFSLTLIPSCSVR